MRTHSEHFSEFLAQHQAKHSLNVVGISKYPALHYREPMEISSQMNSLRLVDYPLSQEIKADPGIDIFEPERLQNLIDQGLHAVVMCVHGQDRSVKTARMLLEDGAPALYLNGGLKGIKDERDTKAVDAFLQVLAKVPFICAVISDAEAIVYSGPRQKIRDLRTDHLLPWFETKDLAFKAVQAKIKTLIKRSNF